MKYWIHYAHLSPDSVLPVGTVVKSGDVVGRIGSKDVNGGWSPHLHLEWRLDKFSIGSYNFGQTKEWTEQRYANPLEMIDKFKLPQPMQWNSFGYEWLQHADYGNGKICFHPGVDLNWSAGDVGLPVYAVAGGVITDMKKGDGGWGSHLILEIDVTEDDMSQEEKDRLSYLEGVIAGVTKSGMYSTPDGSGHMVVTFQGEDQVRTFYGVPADAPISYTKVSTIDISALDRKVEELSSQSPQIVEVVREVQQPIAETPIVPQTVAEKVEPTLAELISMVLRKLFTKK